MKKVDRESIIEAIKNTVDTGRYLGSVSADYMDSHVQMTSLTILFCMAYSSNVSVKKKPKEPRTSIASLERVKWEKISPLLSKKSSILILKIQLS